MNSTELIPFEDFNIRRHYSDKEKRWYFSVIDIVAVLIKESEYKRARDYWSTLKKRLKDEGSQVANNCQQIKMVAADGKQRATDAADVETIFRLVQSIPSPKAEPIKLWLAKVGRGTYPRN